MQTVRLSGCCVLPQAFVVVPGNFNRLPSAQKCRKKCKANKVQPH